jgi:hypothetical protein
MSSRKPRAPFRIARGSEYEKEGLAPQTAAPLPWVAAPITHSHDTVRIVDAEGREIGRMHAGSAHAMVAAMNATQAAAR